jgi:flavin-binding protein dodecin
MFVGANNPPGAAQSYTVVAWIQDGTKPQTITAAISGATASTAQDIVNYVEVAKFDRVSLRLVTSAGATTVYLGGTLAFLPY